MAKGTDFGGVHSSRDLHLIQQTVDIQPAKPKLNLINVPGADGSVDMSELPAGRVVYGDRVLTWTYALYPGDDWHAKHRQVSNILNGRRCEITLDGDDGYYYTGRVTVKKYKTDMLLRQITVEATCSPWMLKRYLTVVESDLHTDFIAITMPNEKKPAVPVIEVTVPATLRWGDMTVDIVAGIFTSLDIELREGDNVLEAKTTNGAGRITITYQEGSL